MKNIPYLFREHENIKLNDAEYDKMEFVGMELSNSTISQVEFTRCTFKKCKFNSAMLMKCRFEDSVFQECDLSIMNIEYSAFNSVTFKNSKVLGVNWTKALSPIDVNFSSCNINLSSFFGLNLSRIIIEECQAKEVDFAETNMTKANLRSSDFTKSRFLKTKLTGADLRNAINYTIDPTCNNIKKAIFSLPEAIGLLSYLDIVID